MRTSVSIALTLLALASQARADFINGDSVGVEFDAAMPGQAHTNIAIGGQFVSPGISIPWSGLDVTFNKASIVVTAAQNISICRIRLGFPRTFHRTRTNYQGLLSRAAMFVGFSPNRFAVWGEGDAASLNFDGLTLSAGQYETIDLSGVSLPGVSTGAVSVPEPSSIILLGVVFAGLACVSFLRIRMMQLSPVFVEQ